MMDDIRSTIARVAFNHWREHPQLPRETTDVIFDGLDPKLQATWLKMADSILAAIARWSGDEALAKSPSHDL